MAWAKCEVGGVVLTWRTGEDTYKDLGKDDCGVEVSKDVPESSGGKLNITSRKVIDDLMIHVYITYQADGAGSGTLVGGKTKYKTSKLRIHPEYLVKMQQRVGNDSFKLKGRKITNVTPVR